MKRKDGTGPRMRWTRLAECPARWHRSEDGGSLLGGQALGPGGQVGRGPASLSGSGDSELRLDLTVSKQTNKERCSHKKSAFFRLAFWGCGGGARIPSPGCGERTGQGRGWDRPGYYEALPVTVPGPLYPPQPLSPENHPQSSLSQHWTSRPLLASPLPSRSQVAERLLSECEERERGHGFRRQTGLGSPVTHAVA